VAAGDAILSHVVTFGRVLREAGIEVGPGRVVDALRALDSVDLARQEDVYFALRQTLVSRRDELELFDRAFDAWFLRAPVVPPPKVRQLEGRTATASADRLRPSDEADGETPDAPLELGASAQELLREKDFAELTGDELRRLRELIARIARTRPHRSSRRRTADPRGDRLDVRQLIRRSLRAGGDPLDRPFRARKEVPRKLVVLCDVSGSMDSYARALLLFLHAVVGAGRGVEAFAFGTRLSRLTPDLATRDPDAALERVTEAVVDWGSGTRIGASLREFNDVYGRRGLSRGAIVLIVSDGWEREDPGLVGREMAKLSRAAYAIVWVNPLKGNPQYQPLAGGMRAALPYVDRFLPGHNLRSLEELAVVLAGIERRHAA
jgi:uncharacterized protein with von Willebrand factor type A (vWA) domain